MSARTRTGILALVGAPTHSSVVATNTSQPLQTLLRNPKVLGTQTESSNDSTTAEMTNTTEAPAPFLDKESDGDAVLAVDDVAKLMRVGRNTIYALVGRNQIPHRRLGKQIRFSRASVMSWLATSWRDAKEGK